MLLSVYNHVHAGTCEGQKRALEPMELELQTVVSYPVPAESRTWVLCKSSNHS